MDNSGRTFISDCDMMRIIYIGLIAALFVVVGCDHGSYEVHEEQVPDGPWRFYTTKSSIPQDDNFTFRASLLSNDNAILLSDGSYCGYNKVLNSDLYWFYACRVDDQTGAALDISGNEVEASASDWFDRVDKDTKYALRAAPYKGYTMVLSSPAVRMKSFNPDGAEDAKHWGFHVKNNEELYISEPIENLDITANWIDGIHYVYPLSDATLYDRRSLVTVKVALGALSSTIIKSVFCRNVMTSAYFLPKSKTYENYVMDGGCDDPLDYYKENTYYSLGTSGEAIKGNMLMVPQGESICLEKSSGENEWNVETQKGNSVTAIVDLPIFSLDYSTQDHDKYRFDELIPEIVVLSGDDGSIRSTIRIPANIEPMKSYTVMIYLSTAYAEAELYLTDWDHEASPDIDFGKVVLPTATVSVAPWDPHDPHDPDDGVITKNKNE